MSNRTRHQSVHNLHSVAQAAAEAGLDFEDPRLREALVVYAASKPTRRQVADLKRRLGVVSSGTSRWDEIAATAATRR